MVDNHKHLHLPLTIEGTTYDINVGGIPPDVDARKISVIYADSFHARSLLIDRLLGLIPEAPEFTTITLLQNQLQGVSYATIRRILIDLAAAGTVRSERPRAQRKGSNTIRWMRG